MHNELHRIFAFVGVTAVLFTASCDGGQSTGGGGNAGQGGAAGNAGAGGQAGAGNNGGNGGSGNNGGDGGSGGVAPSCNGLTDAVRVTQLTVGAASVSGRAVTAQQGGGSIVAWAAGDGKVHVLPLDANDAAAGAELTTDGTRVFGAAATKDDVALLVARDPDYMTFVRLDAAGQKVASADLVGGGDHNTVGVEWFGEFAQTGRLAVRSDGTYAAYHALHRRWPDNIGHQGDTLRLLDKDGAPAGGGGWDWGCSHSMDQRLATGPTGLIPICISDCYPSKGIQFNHNGAKLTDDPAANCAGGFSTALGGLVGVADGFFLVYGDAKGNAHLGHFDAKGMPLSDRALSEPGSSRLAAYEDGLLIGSAGGAGTSIEKLDGKGEPTGEKVEVSAPPPDQDFESRSGGEVAWATISGTSLTVVRVRTCP